MSQIKIIIFLIFALIYQVSLVHAHDYKIRYYLISVIHYTDPERLPWISLNELEFAYEDHDACRAQLLLWADKGDYEVKKDPVSRNLTFVEPNKDKDADWLKATQYFCAQAW